MGRTVPLPRTLATICVGALAIALVAGAKAQSTGGSASDFRLEPRPTPTTPVVGPTDPDAPARSSASPPATAPQPAPTISLPPAPTTQGQPAPAVRRPAPAAQAAPRTAATAGAAPAPASPAAAAPLSPTPPTSAPGDAAAGLPTGAAIVAAPEDPAAGDGTSWWLLPLLAALAAAAGALGWTLWRRTTAPNLLPAPEFVRPRVPAAEPAPAAEADPAPLPATPETTSAAPLGEPLVLSLKATRMSATLVNAALSYRLVVRNGGSLPLSDIAIAGDMISAHASVPNSEMLGGTGTPLPGLHRVTALAPGESVELTGELRLPLSAIVPIRRGEAQLFVPLARLVAVAQAAGGTPVRFRQAVLIGQEPVANARLQPFRLDLGPRLYSQLGQRPIAAAA